MELADVFFEGSLGGFSHVYIGDIILLHHVCLLIRLEPSIEWNTVSVFFLFYSMN